MARLWSSGAELNNAATNGEADTANAALSIEGTVVRSGTYSFKDLASSNGPALQHVCFASDTSRTLYVRFYVRWSSFPGATKNVCMVVNSATTGGAIVRINSSNQLYLYDLGAGGSIGSPSSTLSLDTWYRVEMFVDATSTGGSRTYAFKIDGSIVATSAANLTGSALYQVVLGDYTGYTCYYDDIAINDDQGTFQNSYPGPAQIVHAVPNAAGDASAWTIGGSSPAATNWQGVNEIPADDAVTFNTAKTFNKEDLHNIATPSGIDAADTINVVAVGFRFNKDSGSGATAVKLEIEASSGGTIEQSSGFAATSTTWFNNNIVLPRNYQLTLYDLPGASTTAWSLTDLTNAQIGYKISSGDTPFIQITSVWMLVDYTPAATTSTSTTISTSTTSTSTTSTSSSISTSTTSTSSSISTSTTSTSSSISTSTTSTSSSISTTSTSISTSTTTTISPVSGGLAFGEQNPTLGEIASSWQLWSNGSAVVPTIIGDPDWGKLQLSLNEEGRSRVYDFGDSTSRTITVTENRYGTGQWTATLQIRGDDATPFLQDDATPTWENYTIPIAHTWRYIQVRAVY